MLSCFTQCLGLAVGLGAAGPKLGFTCSRTFVEAQCPLPRNKQAAATIALSTSLRTVGVTQLTSFLHRLVGQALEEPGQGRVLVVDGGGSKRCALLGDNIAEMAVRNGWSVRAHIDL